MSAVASFLFFSYCKMAASVILLLYVNGLVEAYPKTLYSPGEEMHIMPTSCGEMNYCFDKGSDYPEDEIRSALQDFLDQIEDYKINFGDRNGPEINRNGDVDCPALVHIDEPIYYIIDYNDAVRAVAQIPNKFNQIYDVANCSTTDLIGNTRHFDKSSNEGYFCKETRIPLELYVLGTDWTSVEKVKVKDGIPVCCSCRYKDNAPFILH